jgi:cysteinyl-tRNA synthetase
MKYLGETLDIHAGGIDLTFPHHENEIAQSEAITGKPFSRFWLHGEHLIVEGQKMSKSLGNFYTLRDLLDRGYAPEVIRYLLVHLPYRSKLNFTFDGLGGARTSIERLRNFKLRVDTETFPEGRSQEADRRCAEARQAFEEALDDDLNTSEALAAIFEYIRDANASMDAGEFGAANRQSAAELLALFDGVFDVLRPTVKTGGIADQEVEARVAERQQAKRARDFARADAIRQELLDAGVILEDTKEGVRWKRK